MDPLRTMRLLALAAAGCALPALAAQAQIWSSVDGGPPTREWKYVRADQRVRLYARVAGTPLRPVDHHWFKLEATAPALDNTRPRFHFEPVPYEATEIARCAGQPECDADVEPTKLVSRGRPPGVGAMAFQVQVTLSDGERLASPGAEAVESGGLGRAVHKVAVRAADGYLGYLTELFDLPYIFGSDGPDGQHQADLLIGADCADLAVYGARREGLQVPYVSTWTLDQRAREVGRAVRSERGIATDASGEPLRIGPGALRPGDLLLFPGTRHVGVLYEDRDPKGVLDGGDLLLHTCWAPPAIEPLGETACASYPIRALRFPPPPPPKGAPRGPGKRVAW